MDDIPNFIFDADEIEAIKASLGATNVDPDQETPTSEVRPKRRGRPPGSKNRATLEVPTDTGTPMQLPVIPLTRREEREVAQRLANILTGLTGMGGMVKPYVPMTDEEANAIAEPLASYLIRNEPTNGVAREILQNYDLIAMTMGVGAYGVRVYGDRKAEVAAQRPANTEAIQRVSEYQASSNGRQPDEGVSPIISFADASRSGSTPFDV